MSTRSVANKLLIKPNTTLWSSYPSRLQLMAPLPTGVRRVDAPEQATTALVFADDAVSMRDLLATHQERLTRPEVLGVAYPKGNATDVTVGRPKRRYQWTTTTMTSGGNRKPAKPPAHTGRGTVSVPYGVRLVSAGLRRPTELSTKHGRGGSARRLADSSVVAAAHRPAAHSQHIAQHVEGVD